MADLITKLENLINPEVMAQMISAKVENKLRVLPYAKVDNTLRGQAGDTITIPRYGYIGDAVDVAEGEEIPTRQLAVSSVQHTIKKIGIGGILTDEAMLSGYGNPVGQLTHQMSLSITSKTDTDGLEVLYGATTSYKGAGAISYKEVVNAVDVFEEEENSEKVMWVHPKQVTQLRLDTDFIAKDKYGNQVMADGEIGMIANVRVIPSRKVKLNEAGTHYMCPIVKLEADNETEDASPALTIFIKRDTNVEKERVSKKRLTEITGDKMYVCALTDETKVVIANFTKEATV